MPGPDAPPPDAAAFAARAAELGLRLSPEEQANALAVARRLHAAAARVRAFVAARET